MPKLSSRYVEALKPRDDKFFVWDEALPGFGVRLYPSGRRSYVIQYKVKRRTRRLTLGFHGELSADAARRIARIKLGEVAQGGDPADVRRLEREGLTMRELCDRYMMDAELGLIPGKRRRPKKASTIQTDRSRIGAHIIPLLGTHLVKDIGRPEVHQFMRDVATGKARRDRKTKPRGRSIVRGGLPTAARTVGLLGSLLSYAVRIGVIETNPVHGFTKPATEFRQRFLSPDEYRLLGDTLLAAEQSGHNRNALTIIRMLALTGCRRGEIERLRWEEVDEERSCFRFADSKEGRSIRPAGSAALRILADRKPENAKGYVFEGDVPGKAFDGVPKVWMKTVRLKLPDVTPHILRHSFASVANELGFTEATIAAMLGHAAGTTTGRYTHHLDAALVAAAERVSTHIAQLMGARELERARLRELFASWASASSSLSFA